MLSRSILTLTALTALVPALAVHAHTGPRFEVQVHDNKLYAQGYNSANFDDGGGIVRPYFNVIHEHWNTIASVLSSANQPGIDVHTAGLLTGHNLQLKVLGAKKWVGYNLVDPIVLTPLDSNRTISIFYSAPAIYTNAPGSVKTLKTSVANDDHFDLSYDFLTNVLGPALVATDTLYLVELQLLTNAPGIAASDTVNVILAPPGTGSHAAALRLEEFLGIQLPTEVPEPASFGLLVLGGLVLLQRRR